MNIVQSAVPPLPPELLAKFRAIVGEKYAVTDAADIKPYVTEERDLFQGRSPLVLRPGSTTEVAAICKLASEHKIALVPQGGNTGLVGGQTPHNGEVVVSLRRLDKIRDIDVESNTMTCEAGVVLQIAQQKAADVDRLFPLSLGAEGSCTIGGNLSTNAGGTAALAYGVAREMAIGLEVVLADGRVLNALTKLKKDNTGYNLHNLFIGAEGTLGIISELTIRLRGIPDTIAAAACSFETVRGACQATILAIQTGIPVARIELLNAAQVKACNSYSKLSLPETPLLLLEFHGSEVEVAEQSKNFRDIAAECGGGDFTWTTKPEDRTKLWQARHDAYWSVKALRPGDSIGVVATDVCVPISRLADCVTETEEDLKRLNLLSPIVGHVGDGNFHCSLLCDVNDKDEMARGEEFMHRLVERAQAMDGTCTGEHGIGLGKIDYLTDELGEAVDVMRSIKTALDPHGLMNPGKIFAGARP